MDLKRVGAQISVSGVLVLALVASVQPVEAQAISKNSISGVVSLSDGAGAGGVRVCASSGDGWVCTTSSKTGRYEIKGLSRDYSYSVRVSKKGYLTAYHSDNGTSTELCDLTSADNGCSVDPGRRNLKLRLWKRSVIKGKAVDANGKPLRNERFDIAGDWGTVRVDLDSKGRYSAAVGPGVAELTWWVNEVNSTTPQLPHETKLFDLAEGVTKVANLKFRPEVGLRGSSPSAPWDRMRIFQVTAAGLKRFVPEITAQNTWGDGDELGKEWAIGEMKPGTYQVRFVGHLKQSKTLTVKVRPTGLARVIEPKLNDAADPVPDLVTHGFAVRGTPMVGERLVADAQEWQPDWITFNYQWYRDDKLVGDSAIYYPGDEDFGRPLTAVVEAMNGAELLRKMSVTTSTVKLGKFDSARPVIRGKAKVGKRLQAMTGVWNPHQPEFSYRWYRNGKAIPKAKLKSYRLTKKDKGKRITVKVTASSSKYLTATRKSKATKKVSK